VVAGTFEKTALATKCGSLKKLLNIYAYVLRAARKWRVYKRGRAGERQAVSPQGPDEMEAAELLLLLRLQGTLHYQSILHQIHPLHWRLQRQQEDFKKTLRRQMFAALNQKTAFTAAVFDPERLSTAGTSPTV
jgi:hypothetical protein